MMDLKEIIKWFILCFHTLSGNRKISTNFTLVCLFLFCNLCFGLAAKLNSDSDLIVNNNVTKNLVNNFSSFNSSFNDDQRTNVYLSKNENNENFDPSLTGRTFGGGLRFKKIAQALIPLAFQIGAASTWAVVAAVVGFKTLLVALAILKLLLLAGAAKVGAFFGAKGHQTQGWEPHQKEIHLHIHNGQHGTYEHEQIPYYPWDRDGNSLLSADMKKTVTLNPYLQGLDTISTPYGQYIKISDTPITNK